MSEKELEERVMINKKQYLEIEKYIRDNFPHYLMFDQKNRYFDDSNKTITRLENVLRIRSFKDKKQRELTYKVKGENGDLEYNQTLSHYWFYQITRYSRLPEGEIKNKLLEDNVDISSINMITDLYTRRMEVHFSDHILVLDANMYNNIVDYNIEIESNISIENAHELILKYCQMFNLEYKKEYLTKSQRAFKSIKK